MTDNAPRRADRLARPSWRDPRLIVGVLLVLAAVVAGARVFSAADRDAPVYLTAHVLVPGERLRASDLVVGRARLGDTAADYVSAAGPPPAGYVVQRFVGAGELLPAHALLAATQAPAERLVTLPVQPGHLPPDVGPGSAVDVYLSAKAATGAAARPPRLVAHNLAVDVRDGGSSPLSGSTVVSLVVSVPLSEVPAVVHAAEAGNLDVVEVPQAAVAGGLVAASPGPGSGGAASSGSSAP